MGTWRKSSYSSANGGSCVEIADAPGTVLVRDTKQEGRADRTVVRFSPEAWAAFTVSLRSGPRRR